MLIEVTPKYRITSDKLNIVVQTRHTVDPTKSPNWAKKEAEGADPSPRVEWKDVSYHGKVESALTSIIDRSIKESEATSLPELIDYIAEIKSQINNALNPSN